MFENTICEVYKLCDQAQPLLPVLPKYSAQIGQLEDLYLPCLFYLKIGDSKLSIGQFRQFLRTAETTFPQPASSISRAFTGNNHRNTLGSKDNISLARFLSKKYLNVKSKREEITFALTGWRLKQQSSSLLYNLFY